MTFQEAAARQHWRHSYYTIWLVGPNGEREELGYTARKSGRGLLNVLARPSVQERIGRFPGADSITLRKTAAALFLSNGWRIEFGGTIRQESSH